MKFRGAPGLTDAMDQEAHQASMSSEGNLRDVPACRTARAADSTRSVCSRPKTASSSMAPESVGPSWSSPEILHGLWASWPNPRTPRSSRLAPANQTWEPGLNSYSSARSPSSSHTANPGAFWSSRSHDKPQRQTPPTQAGTAESIAGNRACAGAQLAGLCLWTGEAVPPSLGRREKD